MGIFTAIGAAFMTDTLPTVSRVDKAAPTRGFLSNVSRPGPGPRLCPAQRGSSRSNFVRSGHGMKSDASRCFDVLRLVEDDTAAVL